MPNRNIVGDYRYNYQGQELDKETGKVAFELRLYDPRINRWLTPDPYGEFHSPYLAMGNNFPNTIDPDGGCTTCPDNAKVGDTFEHADFGTLTYTEAGGWGNDTYGSILDDVVISNGLNLDKSGFSLNSNITKDRIPGLEKGRPNMGKSVEALILHRTVSSNYPGGWMKSKTKIKGAHFYIDKDGTTYQTASLNKSVAHIYASSSKQMYKDYYGKLKNSNTVGIEVIGNYKNKKWEPLTQDQIDATSILVKQIKTHYKIHNDKVYPHEKVQRKTKGEGQTVLDAINLN